MKPNYDELRIYSYQLALFLSQPIPAGDILSFAGQDVFKGAEPISLPGFFRIQAPNEEVVFQSINGKLDLFLNLPSDNPGISMLHKNAVDMSNLVDLLVRTLKIEGVARIGVLAHMRIPQGGFEQARKFLKGEIFADNLADRLRGFGTSLTFHHDFSDMSLECNRYYEIGYGNREQVGRSDTEGLYITADINTRPDAKSDIKSSSFRDFIAVSWQLIQPKSVVDFLWGN